MLNLKVVFFNRIPRRHFTAAVVTIVMFPHLRPPADPEPLKVCFKNTDSCFQKRIAPPILMNSMGHVIKR